MSQARDMPVDAAVVKQASHWLMLHWQGALDASQQAAFDAWHAANAEHRRAWSRLGHLQQELTRVPASDSLAVLRKQPELRRRQALKLLSSALLLGSTGWFAERTLPWREAMADLHSATGEMLQRTLADGSDLKLNTRSAVDIRYNEHERRIRLLQGEILLASGQGNGSEHKPLIVETAAGEIHALGTRFSVYEVNGGSRVQLYEGALDVRPNAGASMRLAAGQALWFAAGGCGPTGRADANAIAWSEGHIVAERTPLGQFLSELSRYRTGVVRCDPAVAALPLTGVFPLADTDRILLALTQALPVRVQRVSRYWVSVVSRA